ncbi:ryncolin-1-like [Saccostrea cucullata]|uniref:ryncolin-1-like n=1 Tax=Saccostrea cuccullata TaxID=36930 RepID=UPI002ED0DEC9
MALAQSILYVWCFFLCFTNIVCIAPHSNLKGNVESLLKLTPWNWKHLKTSVKVDTPVSVDISLLSHYRLTGKHFNKYQKLQKQRDCASILKSIPNTKGKDGVYSIYPEMKTEKLVYCDMTTEGGGWTVINRRMDGSVDFYRSWDSYKEGFGNVEGEYWLGNEPIHLLTKRSQCELRVDLQKFSGKKAFAKYSSFSVGSESQKFKLTATGYSGTAGDSLAYHNGRPFSMKDAGNDSWKNSCAVDRKAGWWFNGCDYCDLNEPYFTSAVKTDRSVRRRIKRKGEENSMQPQTLYTGCTSSL